MVNMEKELPQPADGQEGRRYRVRLPGFIVEEEMGLGDLIKNATSSFGIVPCAGCVRRATLLNRRVTFFGGRSTRHE